MSRLHHIINKKQQVEQELKQLEKQIYDLETQYLEETFLTGNIIKGWDNYLQNKQKNYVNFYKKSKITPQERIFSLSSVTSPAYQMINEEFKLSEQNKKKKKKLENLQSKTKIYKQIKKKKKDY